MHCPACSHSMTHYDVDGIGIDACEDGCGGLWFDNHEFQKFDEPHEEAGQALLDIPRNPNIKVDHDQRRDCPKCDNITMMRRFFSAHQQVEIDECANCGSIWLDTGELATIRSLYSNEQERKQHAQAMLNEVMGSELEAVQEDQAQRQARTERVRSMLRFLSPSQWIS